MDMIALTVVFAVLAIGVGVAVSGYHAVKYRDSHFDEWTHI